MSVQYPTNETERLHELQQYEILDTPNEAAFDRITRLAARFIDGSTALINFIDDDRQWTKSCSSSNGPTSVPRDNSFCARTILADLPLIIPDTLDDPHFAHNPFVTGPHGIRFYAGTPLRTAEGTNIGTLCIVDTVPRELNDAQIATLNDLAALTVDELELRRAKQAEEALQASQSKLQMIMAQTPTVLWTCDRDLRLTSSIGGGLVRLKLEPDASNGSTLQEIFGQSPDGTKVRIAHQHALRGESSGYEITFGSWHYDVRVEPLRDNKHEIVGCIGLAIDITERKHAESWLRASEERYRTLAETATDAIYTVSAAGLFTSLNPAFAHITGWSCDELLGRHFNAIIHPDDMQFAAEIFRRLLAGDAIAPFELPLLCKNGRYVVCEFAATRQVQGGAVVGILGIARDITARKRAEQALHDSNARLQAIFNSGPECVKLVAADGTLLEINPAGLAMIEADSADQVLGRSVFDLLHPDDRAVYQRRLKAVAHGNSNILRFRVIGLKGGLHWMESNSVPLRDQSGAITAVLSVTRDITERKAADGALADAYARLSTLSAQVHQSRDLLRTSFDGLDDGMLLAGSGGKILAVNQALAVLLGQTPERIVGGIWHDICISPSIGFPGSVVVQTLYDGRPRRRRERFTTTDNRHYILDLQTLPLISGEQTVDQVILHVANVTERIQMEALVMQNERLAATGKLAATMAHEINTPLQSIRSCLYLAGKSADTQREKYLALAREEIDRISGILRHLLDLHRPGSGTFVPINLTELVERVLLLTGGTMAERRVEPERDLSPELPPLYGRVDQLTQVLLNLTLNAVEAMQEGGTIRFATRMVNEGSLEQPSKIVLEITDSGHGMSPETQSHIFEPFFTTKPDGTGIGLAVSQKIIAQHGGEIMVRSEPSIGSTFSMTFTLTGRPAVDVEDES